VRELPTLVRIGTRGSTLALRQTALVADLLRAAWPGIAIEIQVISTYGDQVTDVPLPDIGVTGAFTSNLEIALRDGAVDLAVHSVKDLPVGSSPGAVIGAMPERGNPADVLISRDGYTLATLPHGARVGTCSRRRAAQLRRLRPDLEPVDIRGNVDTRINKAFAPDSPYDAIVLAYAGLERLGRLDVVSEVIPLHILLPAPGQAALGVQCRDEAVWLDLLRPLVHAETETAIAAERGFLAGLGGGCSLPVAAHAVIENHSVELHGRVSAPDGSAHLDLRRIYSIERVSAESGWKIGTDLARLFVEQGAGALMEGTQTQ
jgi:hydroxymethylbilane synthase